MKHFPIDGRCFLFEKAFFVYKQHLFIDKRYIIRYNQINNLKGKDLAFHADDVEPPVKSPSTLLKIIGNEVL